MVLYRDELYNPVMEPIKTFRIITLGDTAVGKTSLFIKYIEDQFKEAIASTIAVNHHYKEILIDGSKVHLQMWDTAGQERYKSIVRQMYRGADGFIFVYDVSNDRSFSEMKNIVSELSGILDPKFTVLVGNKIDLIEDSDELKEKKQVLERYATENKFKYFFTSAKTGVNVNEVFEHLSRFLFYNKDSTAKPKNALLAPKKKKWRVCF